MADESDTVDRREESNIATVEGESNVQEFNREALELNIFSIARKEAVLHALQIRATTTAADRHAPRPSTIISTARNRSQLKEELERGLRAILDASCNKRLETFHFVVMRLDREYTESDVLDCFFDEAESQMNETDDPEKAIIGEVFGVTASI